MFTHLSRHIQSFFAALVFIMGISLAARGAEQEGIIGFDSGRWQLQPGSRIVEYMGVRSLRGGASLKDAVFENGIIEYDVAFTGTRSFPSLIFRNQGGGNYEQFYVRPHKSGKPDALQYTPVFAGLGCWQLYSGEGFTAVRAFQNEKWLHVKLEVSGSQARVYLDNEANPALVIKALKHGASKGGVGFLMTPDGTAHFANFRLDPKESIDLGPPPEDDTAPGMIMDWELSQAFKYTSVSRREYPGGERLEEIQWQKVRSEESGLVNIGRYVNKGPMVPDAVYARTFISSDSDRTMRLQFGYSDIASVFLNGKILFTGNSQFQLRDPFFQGLVGLFDTVYLPLKKGENELMFMVLESMGGWGFKCADADAVYQHESLTRIWEIAHKLSYPETVVYDGKRDRLYLSNLYSDTRQFISRLTLNGDVENREWVSGLVRPTGMVLFGDRLYVVERANMAEIDVDTGKILRRYPIPNPGFPNDIAADDKGNIYISDGMPGRILKFSDGKFSVWKQGSEFAQCNGLHFYEGTLYVGTSSDWSIKRIDLKAENAPLKGALTVFYPGAIVDGIESDGEGNILASDYNGKIFRISPNGEKTLLLDTRRPSQFCANFAFIPEKKLLVIPTLIQNRVVAYRLKDE